MLQLDEIDEETERLFSHLRGLANGDESEDVDLIDLFAVGIKYHEPSLYSFTDQHSLYNPVIKNMVLLLLRVIGTASSVYLILLEKVLYPLTFEEICIYIPKDVIFESLRNPATQAFTINMLSERLHCDDGVRDFLLRTNLFQFLSEDLLAKDKDDSNLVLLIEKLIYGSGKHPIILPAGMFKLLADKSEDQILMPGRFYNHIMMLGFVATKDVSSQPWGRRLFPFSLKNVLAFDELQPESQCIVLVASTYMSWLEIVPFSWLKPFISEFLEYVVAHYPNTTKQDYTNLHVITYQDLLINLSHSQGESLEYANEFLSRPDVYIVDESEPTSHVLFSRVCLTHIPEKETFFQNSFNTLDIKSGSLFVTSCVIALVQDEEFFHILAASGKLTTENIRAWSQDTIFDFVSAMAKHDYSALYLLSELQVLVWRPFLNENPLCHKVMWELKKDTLRQLLLHRKIDLGFWKKEFSDCLYEMENGRRLDNIAPQVDVMNSDA